jgi:nucleoside-diphosphate-sugar epimerase
MMRRLLADGISCRAAVHRDDNGFPEGIEIVRGARLDADFDWSNMLSGCDAVIHLGARVHVMNETSVDPLAEYRRTNVDGTLRLARQARAVGIRRFVFLSSIKANGEATAPGAPFTELSTPQPVDPYGISKLEAEQGLQELSGASNMAHVIIRPPLIYGPGVRGNFISMMRWLQRGVPLPLRSIENRRSLIGIDNLVDVIAHCLASPAATNQLFLASDGEDLSTPDMLGRLADAIGARARLLPFPSPLLAVAARSLGQGAKLDRLRDSLQVSPAKAINILGWRAPVSVDEGFRSTAAWFLEAERKS